jgi:hypothetical protein
MLDYNGHSRRIADPQRQGRACVGCFVVWEVGRSGVIDYGTSSQPSGFISLRDAATAAGIHRVSLWKRLRESGIAVYRDPRDRRRRLLRRTDAEQLFGRPQRIGQRKEAAVA